MSEETMNGVSCKHHMKELLVSAEELVKQAISKHLDTHFDPFRIVDFGCSVGPNAFFAVGNIIGAVENRYRSQQKEAPEFHVFFNDLIDNDFNTLFKLLPASRKYLAAAAPGSFYTRLFPRATLHFAHCSTALHWLSRIPEEVTQRSSMAWNRGRIHYSGAGKEVREAYSSQYKRDMEGFLSARADELVAGGLMVLVLIGYPDGYMLASDSGIGEAFDILGSCLYDMAKMGKVSEEEVDCFNLPFYYPCASELKALIESNGVFCIEGMAELGAPMRSNPDPRTVTSHLRAVIGVLIEERFGTGIVDEVFQLHMEKLLKKPIVDETHQKETVYFLFLKRKL